MRNFVQSGEMLDLPAPTGGVIAGKGYLIGGIFGVASVTADAGVIVAFAVEGVFDLDAKSTDTFNPGDPAFWDATNAYVTSTKTGNTFVGATTEAKASGDLAVNVNLFERVYAPAAAITKPAATAATNSTPYGYSQAQADAIKTAVINIIGALEGAGIIVPG